MNRTAVFTWAGRLAVLALAIAATLHRPAIYTAANVHLHDGLLYGKNGHPASGELELRYPDTHLLMRGRIVDGRFSGIVDEWYPDGKPRARYEYMEQGDVVSVSTWYPSGDLAELYEMQHGPSGFAYASRYLSWYQGGAKKKITKYQDDKPLSEIEWDESGKRTNLSRNNPPGPAQYLAYSTLLQAGVTDNSAPDQDDDSDGPD